MKRADQSQQGKSFLDLIEEAVHLLRTAPAGALAVYYLGSLPFVLGFLFFWVDMGRSALAEERLTGGALGVAALFLWMKFCQALFARQLREVLLGSPLLPLNFVRCRRIFITQAALQWTGLFLLPISLLPVLTFPWVYAFYQNVTVMADGDSFETHQLLRSALRQAVLWPRQNHLLLAILGGFGFIVFLNWCMVGLALPQLFKMSFGVESIFSRSPESLLNTTFFAAMAGLTYLCVDPILKAAYALRCFYGESLKTGADLKAELRRSARSAPQMAAVLAAAILLTGIGGASALVTCPGGTPDNSPALQRWVDPGQAEQVPKGRPSGAARLEFNRPCGTWWIAGDLDPTLKHWAILGSPSGTGSASSVSFSIITACRGIGGRFPIILAGSVALTLESGDASRTAPKPSPAPTISPSLSSPELDRTISEVMQQDKYAWRAPREKTAKPEQGVIGRFLDRVLDMVRDWGKAAAEWLGKLLRKLFSSRSVSSTPTATGINWIVWLYVLVYLLLAAVVVALALLLLRVWQRRHGRPETVASEPIQPVPDLADENTSADHLPEDGWLKLARELWEHGELRLALRAFYLASLAHLAGCNLISLARFKSNRDYETELRRRGHSFPELLTLFGENVSVFDRTWYGLHEINGDLLARFAANVERIKMGAGI